MIQDIATGILKELLKPESNKYKHFLSETIMW